MKNNRLIRLRIGANIVGYARYEGGSTWYSGNLSAWNGVPVLYEQSDRCTGFRDKNRRLLFENDIIRIKYRGRELVVEIIYDEMLGEFLLKEFNGEEFYEMDLLEKNQFTSNIEWYSYTFIQNF